MELQSLIPRHKWRLCETNLYSGVSPWKYLVGLGSQWTWIENNNLENSKRVKNSWSLLESNMIRYYTRVKCFAKEEFHLRIFTRKCNAWSCLIPKRFRMFWLFFSYTTLFFQFGCIATLDPRSASLIRGAEKKGAILLRRIIIHLIHFCQKGKFQFCRIGL